MMQLVDCFELVLPIAYLTDLYNGGLCLRLYEKYEYRSCSRSESHRWMELLRFEQACSEGRWQNSQNVQGYFTPKDFRLNCAYTSAKLMQGLFMFLPVEFYQLLELHLVLTRFN